MFLSRILYPVEVLGPGKRVGIWMAGCPRRCPGCSNPELWEQPERYRTDLATAMRLIDLIRAEHPIDGFTLTGGDPFYQPDALRALLPRLKEISPDILVYTGYTYEELPQDILRDIAVLIDGPYVEARNRREVLRGSDNQRVIILKEEYRASYEAYLQIKESRIQNFSTREGIVSVGIHAPGYEQALKQAAKEKGLEEAQHG